MNTAAIDRIDIETELQAAIDANDLYLHYQPKADLQTGQMAGVEALLRWSHPTHGLIPPSVLIPVAENSALIVRLGDWVIKQVCKDIADWDMAGLLVPCVAINISPIQLQDRGFVNRLSGLLATARVNAEKISLEITESVLMYRSENIDQTFRDFKKQGYVLALDDFGTGYSALSYLKHFPFDYVKVDRLLRSRIAAKPWGCFHHAGRYLDGT